MLCIFIIKTDIFGQTIFFNNGKYGIIDNESKEVVIFAEYDMITAGSINESYGTTKSAHSFILKKDNKYYFLLKKYWKTSTTKQNADSGRNFPPLERDGSVEWQLLSQEFDTLYRLELDVFHYRKDATIRDFEIYLGDTCFQVYKGIHHIVFRKDGKYGLLTFDKASRIFGSYVVGRLRYTRIEYSIDNIQIHPAKYERIMHFPLGKGVDSKLLVTFREKKYGILNLGENTEVKPQFNSGPEKVLLNHNFSVSYEHDYYFVKKNNLWGVVYFTPKNKDLLTCVSFRYERLADIAKNIRSVDFYNRHFFDEGNIKRVQYENTYTSCLYSTDQDSTPVQLEFIIRDGETNLPTRRNSTNNKEELNKNYIPETEKYITFTPTINNKSVVQQKEYEYLFTSNIQNIVYSKKLTTPIFFVVKLDRTEDVLNSEYDLYKRGETKKDVVYSARSYDYISPRLDYISRKPRALAIYHFINDNFVPWSEFTDEDNTTYEIVTEFKNYEHYYPERKKVTYSSDFILKSTKLENEKYKHTFFNFDGTKVYEITSKYPIDYWSFIQTDPNRISSFVPDEHFALEFYTEIPGKKNPKRKLVCNYNVKTKQFYK